RLGEAAKRTVGNSANQLPDMAYFANSIAGNGYAKLPSGLIIQWGSFAVTTTNGVVNSLSVTLPVAFPSSLLMVNAMFSTQDPSTRFVGFDTAKSSRGVINFTYVTPTTNTIYWIVLGY
ncbi:MULTISPECIES: gp53-like domain-containing protein, partial [Enterobacteriaceae]